MFSTKCLDLGMDKGRDKGNTQYIITPKKHTNVKCTAHARVTLGAALGAA